MSSCEVCKEPESKWKYKCPKCRVRYCSLPCFKVHQEVPCAPSAAQGPKAKGADAQAPATATVLEVPFAHDEAEEAVFRVAPEVLKSVAEDSIVKGLLQTASIRDTARAILLAKDQEQALDAALQDSQEFYDLVDVMLVKAGARDPDGASLL